MIHFIKNEGEKAMHEEMMEVEQERSGGRKRDETERDSVDIF